ncbi:MAG TPA: tRNA (adenosine(37)-N6)-dimethylallyltransferase MiaA [Patescibacteria group bacterium]
MQKVLIICGPTATGKTSLALKIAKILGGASILSADSRQIYTGLDIVSGKDIPKDLDSSIRFFGINLFKPNQIANLSEYVGYARKVLKEEISENHPVIIVGGTGLYLKGLTEELSDIGVPNDLDLRDRLSSLSTASLQDELKKLDQNKFDSLNNSDKNNPRRLIRYIEIASNGDHKKILTSLPDVEFVWIGLSPRANLAELIKDRVVERISHGAVDEVKKLLKNYPDTGLPIYSSLGVKELITFIDNKISDVDMIDLWTRSEINYSKRQMVWFKKQPNIIWYDESTDPKDLALKLAKIIKPNEQK